MPVLTIDFESHSDSDYSLSRLTTEEYIRSPRFEVIGVSVKVESEPPRWFSGNLSDTYKWLLRFPWATSIAVAHNAAFDMAILNWIFDIRPARIADTLSMARAIDGPDAGNSLAKLAERHGLGVKGNEVINALGKRRLDFSPAELARYGEYCCNDGDLTYDLFNKLATGFPLAELRTIDLTIRMFTEPVLGLDREVLEDHLGQVLDRKAKLLDGVGISSEDLMSNDKLARVIADLSVHPPTKISPTTGKEAWAFAKNDEGFKALLEHEDERVQGIVAARLGIKSTLEETRTQRFIDISKRGTLPVPLRYYAAHTGRWGGCLVADSEVVVYNLSHGVQTKRITDVLLDDLVWDGEAFVPHEGVVFSGYSEVIEWDGVKGTADHVVFTDAGEMPLRDAMQGAHRIAVARSPDKDAVDAAWRLSRQYEE